MSTQNVIDKKSQDMTIDPGESGDSFVQFDISATGEFRIGVDDTDDSFRISQGSALGTNDTFVMSAAGERTLPLQPAFLASESTGTDVTGDSTNYTIVFDTEYFDQNGDFDGSTTFTAPVTAKYMFSCLVSIGGITASHTVGTVRFVTSNRTYTSRGGNVGAEVDANDEFTIVVSLLVDMDASDTASLELDVVNGAKVIDMKSSSFFSGYLAC